MENRSFLSELSKRTNSVPFYASTVHNLVSAYGLHKEVTVLKPTEARTSDLLEFHSKNYISFIEKFDTNNIDAERLGDEGEEFGFGYDCPISKGLSTYIKLVAGATLDCVRALTSSRTRLAVNFGGGWHHATQSAASGFCYVNDCVLALLKLREHYHRVLYLDIDAHHADAVQDAFLFTSKVMTVSVHKHEPGFYPGTGDITEVGCGKGKGYTINLPLKEGLTDEQFISTLDRVLPLVAEKFAPDAVVLQCGADALGCDPVQAFNLTPNSYVHVLRWVRSLNKPTLILGGGGYNKTATAKCWTRLTAEIVGQNLKEDIPAHSHFPLYGPDFSFEIKPGKLRNLNSTEYLDALVLKTKVNLDMYLPSAQLQ